MKSLLELAWKAETPLELYAPATEGPVIFRAVLSPAGEITFGRADVRDANRQNVDIRRLPYTPCDALGRTGNRRDSHEPRWDHASPLQAAAARNKPYWDAPSLDSLEGK